MVFKTPYPPPKKRSGKKMFLIFESWYIRLSFQFFTGRIKIVMTWLSGFDRPSNGNHGQFYQVAPGIVVETFNMPGQGDRVLPDISRVRLHRYYF